MFCFDLFALFSLLPPPFFCSSGKQYSGYEENKPLYLVFWLTPGLIILIEIFLTQQTLHLSSSFCIHLFLFPSSTYLSNLNISMGNTYTGHKMEKVQNGLWGKVTLSLTFVPQSSDLTNPSILKTHFDFPLI